MLTDLIITRDIISELESWHCPKLGELEFRGLRIEEGWKSESLHVVLSLTTLIFFLVVVVAKLVYGDWGIAWNVGSFLVALATLLWMWASHAAS